MNQDRHVQSRARVPDRIQLGIVQLEPSAVGLLVPQADLFEDFQALGAGLDVLFELLGRPCPEAGADIAEIDICEEHHPLGIWAALDRRQPLA